MPQDGVAVAAAPLPVVALIGRPNVGKSTLFNQLTRTRDAIVTDLPGVTRDRRYGICRSTPRPYVVIDTGGLGEPDLTLAAEVERQSRLAIAEAELLLLVVEARGGLLAADHALARELRSTGKPVLVLVNKSDGIDPDVAAAEAAVLGLPAVLISAAHRQNFSELFDELEARLDLGLPAPNPAEGFEDAVEPAPTDPSAGTARASFRRADGPIRVAVIGRPNVGKSTLINRLLGEERLLAADMPGTTRDSIDVALERDGQPFVFVDTAGIRRRAKVDEVVEKFSVIKALQALEQAEVAIVLIDAKAGVTEQDSVVLGHALDAGRALLIAINKWDGLERHERTAVERELDRRLDYVRYAPRVPISALHGSGLGELIRLVRRVHRSSYIEFTPAEITEVLQQAMDKYQPPLVNGRTAKFRYAHQGGRNPPRIIVHGNRLETLPEAYKRYLENFVRERYKLVGTPVRLDFRANKNPYEGKVNPLSDRQVRRKRRLLRHVKR